MTKIDCFDSRPSCFDCRGWVSRLANRFGKTYHLSYLRRKLERLRERVPESMQNLEEWLIRVAKLRANRLPGKRLVRDVPNEELIVTLLLLEIQDRRGSP